MTISTNKAKVTNLKIEGEPAGHAHGGVNRTADGNSRFLEDHPLIVESLTLTYSNEDFALNLMITKALDKNGNRLFQDGHRASLRREVNAGTLQEIQLAMINSGSEYKLEEAKATLKS